MSDHTDETISHQVATGSGIEIAVTEFAGTGPVLLLVHATGFCGAVLEPMASQLAGSFRCIAIDLRGHGRSGSPIDEEGPLVPSEHDGYQWSALAQDVTDVINALDIKSPYGFGHSCGGATLLLAELANPGTFAGMYLYEPVVIPGPPMPPMIAGNRLAEGALRRRETFASRRDAMENFSRKPPFDQLHPAALTAYVNCGFSDEPDGSVRLRCDPRHESLVYAHGLSHDAYGRLTEITCPVTLACGQESDAFGPDVLGKVAKRLGMGPVEVLPILGHFGPLQDPAMVASSVSAFLSPKAAT